MLNNEESNGTGIQPSIKYGPQTWVKKGIQPKADRDFAKEAEAVKKLHPAEHDYRCAWCGKSPSEVSPGVDKGSIAVGGKTFEFVHTAANDDMHMFINGSHDPRLCPECIERGALTAALSPQPEPRSAEEDAASNETSPQSLQPRKDVTQDPTPDPQDFAFTPGFSWEKPIEQELLAFVRTMKHNMRSHQATTIWGKRQKREAECYADAYETVEEQILKEIRLRDKAR